MSDSEIRELRRQWRETGTQEDLVRYVTARTRHEPDLQARTDACAAAGGVVAQSLSTERPKEIQHNHQDTYTSTYLRSWCMRVSDLCEIAKRPQWVVAVRERVLARLRAGKTGNPDKKGKEGFLPWWIVEEVEGSENREPWLQAWRLADMGTRGWGGEVRREVLVEAMKVVEEEWLREL